MIRRSGYTLLEVMLAIAIGLLLVAALYVALDVQIRYMQAGRNAVAEGQLARGLLSRIGADIRMHMGKLPASQSTTTTTTPTATNTTSNAGSSTAGSLGTSQFSYGIQGDGTQLMLFVSAVPRYGRGAADNQNGDSDLRRIIYTLLPGTGLARIESRSFSTDAGDLADATPDILAQEVISLQFQYYDASSGSWMTSWDGTTSGPPLAVEITLGLQPPVDLISMRHETPQPTYYRMVVAIPTATLPSDSAATSTASQPTTTTSP